jgi:PhnB protein
LQINPHLCFDGQCEAAFLFYRQVLGGEITTMLSYGESPMAQQVPPEWQSKILHATLSFDGGQLAGVDLLPGTYKSPQGFFVMIGVTAPAKAEAAFHELAEGGTVQIPFQQTFWTTGFGMLVDRFGIPWEVNCQAAPPPNTAT